MQVAGYFQGVMGTGEHGRQLAAALRTKQIPVSVVTLHPDASPEDEDLAELSEESSATDPFEGFNLLCANADAVPHVAAQLGSDFFANRYTIGFWAWEVSSFPDRSADAFGFVDEVWVGSRHVRDAVSKVATRPVLAIPQPVSLPAGSERAAPPSGLPGGFRFLFAFDYLSVFERKNPLGAITAFSRAFPPGSGASLIVKSLNHEHYPAPHERLRDAAAGHPDIHLIEGRLSRAERDGLMNAADCYVSLHRAEGFGYTLAEAMWLGKPVIATGYSGNVDFMTAENSYLVDYTLVPIGTGNDPYPAEGEWAEPNLERASALMRHVVENPDEAAARGRRAARDIRDTHSPDAAGRAMRDRLDVLVRAELSRHRRRVVFQPTATRARELIQSGPLPPRRSRFGPPQRAARRLLLRLLKPVTVHQRLIDQELLNAVDALRTRVDSLEEAVRSGITSHRSGRS
jgi:hypothetical protein